ncbi:toprim domain-containing protein [Silicimonas sp. MF1-12-2]|uniref:DUF7146 domain-containing protein n=1 Tax=Silicimonas sp. MF1-12-2 TaxID=3384793 RepID=UPI0039B4ACAA
MNAKQLTEALNGKWQRNQGRALCPVCGGDPKNPPLSIKDGQKGVLFFCHKSRCAFSDIAENLRLHGLDEALREQDTGDNLLVARKAWADDTKRREGQARQCWTDCTEIDGTPAETYLRRRGIAIEADNLGFHPACWHGPTAHRYPALVAKIEGGEGFAVHRTYLTQDGRKAEIAPNKMTLGPMRGGCVRLTYAGGQPWIVGEGIESTLSALIRYGKPASACAALSTSGMINMRLPSHPGRLIIALDGDEAGRTAAKELGTRAVLSDWSVDFADPGDGKDHNDLLEREAF